MSIFWTVCKIVFYTWALNVVFRQSFNLIFILWKKPLVWIGIVAVLSLLHILIASLLAWDPRLVSSALLFAFILNTSRSIPKAATGKNSANLAYQEMGIKHGKLKHRIGLATFAIVSIAAYALFFAEVCNPDQECKPIMLSLTY